MTRGAARMMPVLAGFAGLGANEANVVGVLVVLGVGAPAAAAVALLQRLSLTVVPTVGGALAYVALRRRRSRIHRAERRSGASTHAPMISCA